MVKIRPENKDQTFFYIFSVVLKVCNNDDQTLFFITLTFARSRTIEKPLPLASVFNSTLETWQMLMHEKTCLIPIIQMLHKIL